MHRDAIFMKAVRIFLIGMICLMLSPQASIAQTVAHLQPDAAGKGMTIALQMLSHRDSFNTFGVDGLAPAGLTVKLVDEIDKQRVVIGIPVVSWQGRMIQVPLFIHPAAWEGPVPIRVTRGNSPGDIVNFNIVPIQQTIDVVGSVTLGDRSLGRSFTNGNTLVVQSIRVRGDIGNRSQVAIDLQDPDAATPGNPRYLPLTILSAGPITLENVDLDLSARGKDGGPGGGGGGSGNVGTGGAGFTGGGSSSSESDSNLGVASNGTFASGGRSFTGVLGGGTDAGDQGGGGGTGHPFGSSGQAGIGQDASRPGGFGGGSAGGEDLDAELAFGGGGGGFAEEGTQGDGVGNNAGKRTGGRLLLPLAGGSGGGAGNTLDDDVSPAGSGGGGGGALSIVSYDAIELTNTKLLLRGDSGTTGVARTGGGGGGAGGGVSASALASFEANGLTIDVSGGKGGDATENGLAGGAGSMGISRLDGLDDTTNSQLPPTNQFGLSQKRLPQQTSEYVTVSGYAGSEDILANDIAVYYRNLHTQWVRVDTVAFIENGRRVWRKSIPSLNDSLLFVSAYQRVSSPRTTASDAEPSWISTHVSHQIMRGVSRSQLTAPDTIFFPLTKVGRLKDSLVLIRNLGEAALSILDLSTTAPFTASDFAQQIGGYDSGTVRIAYAPTTAGQHVQTAQLTTDQGSKNIVLIGNAIETDEQIQLSPNERLNFEPTRVGECDTVLLTITSLGEDIAVINFGRLLQPPFSIDTTGKKTRLAKNERETFTVRFCPIDSGLALDTAFITDLDSVYVRGIGLRSILVKNDTILNEPICLNGETIVQDTIHNLGNEPIEIDDVKLFVGYIGLLNEDGPWSVAPHSFYVFRYRVAPSGAGSYEDSVLYSYRSDSVAVGRFIYSVNQRNVTAAIGEFFVCATSSIDQPLVITNDGSQAASISITGFDDKFSSTDILNFSLGKGSRSVAITFTPAAETGEFVDTISVNVSTPGCGDTVISVVLRGFGTFERLVYSKDTIDFGDVEIGACMTDSLFITNVCGPPDKVTPQQFPDIEGFTTTLIEEVTLASGEGIWVYYEFCPTVEGDATRAHTADASDTLVTVQLLGRGIPKPGADTLKLTQTSDVIVIGEVKSTFIEIDQLIGEQKLEWVALTVHYDPSLLRLVNVLTQSESVAHTDDPATGKVAILWEGELASGARLELKWQALLGTEAIASIIIDAATISTAPAAVSQVLSNGMLMIGDCFGLAGNVIPGSVAVGIIRPQPVTEAVNVAVRTSGEMSGLATIRNSLGAIVAGIPLQAVQGDQIVSIPVSHLTSGAYWLEVEIAGYRRVQNFWK